MKKVFTGKIKILLVLAAFFLISCERNPNPPTGTHVTTTSPEFLELAKKMNPLLDCGRIDCCFMDGIETSCALVQGCLDAGFCVVVATK